MVTGLHGLHVLIGLIGLLIILAFALAGDFKKGKTEMVKTMGLYWHFVDAVWIAVFTTIYLVGVTNMTTREFLLSAWDWNPLLTAAIVPRPFFFMD